MSTPLQEWSSETLTNCHQQSYSGQILCIQKSGYGTTYDVDFGYDMASKATKICILSVLFGYQIKLGSQKTHEGYLLEVYLHCMSSEQIRCTRNFLHLQLTNLVHPLCSKGSSSNHKLCSAKSV